MPAIPFEDAPVSKSDTWDADAAVKGVREWAGVNENEPTDAAFTKYAEAFALLEGPNDNLTSYKLPYKQVEDGKLVINPRGVSAAIGALNGGRGGDMDISEADKKAAYAVLAKAYNKAYPDQEPPELKAVTDLPSKGVYVDLPGSFERISDQLAAKLKPYLLYKGNAGEADFCSLVATYADHGVASVLEDALAGGCCAWDDANATYYRIPWGTVNGEPNWIGEPTEVPVTELLSGAAKAAYAAFTKGFLRKGQMADLKGAVDRLQKAHDHEDAKAGPKLHVKRAIAQIQKVVDDHEDDGGDEKDFVTEAHRERLDKAAGHAQKALDHADTTEPMAKHIKAAKAKIEGVRDAHAPEDDSDDEKRIRLEKAGRAVSAANEKKLNAAKSHLKAISDDDEAHAEVRKSASDGADSIDAIFTLGQGGDAGQDYDDTGDFVGTDVGAYTDGEPNKSLKAAIVACSGELPENVKAALSKARMAVAQKALGHAQAIIDHEQAGEDHKGLATAAKSKLKSVMGEGATGPDSDGPALGTDPSTAEPGQGHAEKSFLDRASAMADEAWLGIAENEESTAFDLDAALPAIERLYGAAKEARREVEAIVKAAQLDGALADAESAIDRDLDAAEAVAVE